MEEIKNTNLDEEITEEQEIAQKPLEEKVAEKPAKKNGLLTAGVALMFATSALSLGVSCYQIFSKDKNDGSNVGSHENIGSVNYGQSSVSISEDGYWVINGTKTNVRAEAQDGQNGQNGENGAAAPTIVDARIIPLDKWNITTSIVFTMSDGSYVTTNAQTQVLNGHYYEAENATDLVKLIDNYGVEKVRLTGNVLLTRVLEIEKNVEIDLNGKTLTYTSANPIKVEAGCGLTLENGVVDFQTDKAVVLEGNDSGVVFEGVTVKASSTVVEALGSNASIKLVNSSITTVEPEVESYSTAVGSLFVVKGANANIEVKAAKINTSKVIVAATETAEAFSLKLESSEVKTTANLLSVNTEEVVPTLVVDDNTMEKADIAGLNDSAITDGNFNFELPSSLLGEGMKNFSVNGSWVVAEDFNALVAKVEAGSTITLTEDIDLAKTVQITKKLTIDLNGHKLFNTTDIWNTTIKDWSLISVRGGDLTIKNGRLEAKANDCHAIDVNGGSLTIESGNYLGNISAVYILEGNVTINGGSFDVVQLSEFKDKRYLVNCLDSSYTAGSAVVTINGGSFVGFNPVSNLAEGANTNFVANGNFVVEENGVCRVNPIEVFEHVVSQLSDGAVVTLMGDVDLTNTINITEEVTIDLNGHKLFNTTDIWNTANKDWSLISVNGGDLTIKNGTLEAKANDCYAIDVKSGSLTIESGNYLGNVSAIYLIEGNVTINGGTFDVVQPSEFNDKRYLVNCLDNSYRTGSAVVAINGGSFVGFNPVNNSAEGENTSFITDGHAVVESNGAYTVVEAEGIVYASTEEKLLAAVADETATTIVVVNNIDLTNTVKITREVTIDLNGHKLFNTTDIWNEANKDWSLISVNGGNLTIKNGTLEAKTNDCYAIDVKSGSLTIESGSYLGNMSAIYLIEGNVTINGGTFDIAQLSDFNDKRYMVNCLDNSYRTGSAVVAINGGSFVGFNPVSNSAEGANTNFVTDGHAVVESNGAYTVVEAEGIVYASTEEKLLAAVADETATTIVVVNNIDLTNTVKITREVTIDLNGHKLFNTTDIWNEANNDWSLISVNGGDLTIKNGTLEAKANDCFAIDVKSGSLTIESGSYLGNISAIYLIEGNVTINGGTFDVVQLSDFSDKRYLVNCLDDSYTAGSAVVTINGGSFVGFNPVNNLAEGPNTNFGTEGYEVVENNGVYTIVAE